MSIERSPSSVFSEHLTIAAWNVNKLKRHVRNNDFLDFCTTFDILGLLETWAKSVNQYSTLLEGFKAHCTVCSKENNYSVG